MAGKWILHMCTFKTCMHASVSDLCKDVCECINFERETTIELPRKKKKKSLWSPAVAENLCP